MAEVHLPRSLVALFPGASRRVTARGSTVADVIADLDAQVPGIRNRLLDAGPSIRTHINIFVAGERAMLSTPVPDDATVHVIPAVSGGTIDPTQPKLEEGPMEERFFPAPAAEARPIANDEPDRKDGAHPGGIDDPRALQILSTEHWSLLTARSLVYNETFARGGMFLALLSASLLVLGLIATATGFSDAFLTVAALILGLDLFVGLATLGRINGASEEDIRYIQGMNRLRHAYHEMVPGLEDYFITSRYDDAESVLAFYGPSAPSAIGGILHGFTTMPGMIAVICSAVGGVLVAVLVLLATDDGMLAGAGAVLTFVVLFLVGLYYGFKAATDFATSMEARWPAPGSKPVAPREG